jgi:TolB protein
MNADGSNQTNVSNTPTVLESHFSWSPDSQEIAFDSWREDPYETKDYYTIYVADVDGSKLTRLTKMSRVHDQEPAWSPDGEKIAFSSNRDGNFEIYVIDASHNN